MKKREDIIIAINEVLILGVIQLLGEIQATQIIDQENLEIEVHSQVQEVARKISEAGIHLIMVRIYYFSIKNLALTLNYRIRME